MISTFLWELTSALPLKEEWVQKSSGVVLNIRNKWLLSLESTDLLRSQEPHGNVKHEFMWVAAFSWLCEEEIVVYQNKPSSMTAELYRASSDYHLERWTLQHPFNVLSAGHNGICLKGWEGRLPSNEKDGTIVQKEKYSGCCKAEGAKHSTVFPVKGAIRPFSGYDQNQQAVQSNGLLSPRKK